MTEIYIVERPELLNFWRRRSKDFPHTQIGQFAAKYLADTIADIRRRRCYLTTG